MKKLLLALTFVGAILTSAFTPLFAQEEPDELFQQVLIPKEVFVGDKARIEYSFRSPVDFFAMADPSCINGDTLVFDVNQKIFTDLADRCTVTQVMLLRNGLAYSFVVDLIPWKPGSIDFEVFNLTQMCIDSKSRGDEPGESEQEVDPQQMVYKIDMVPITIESIMEKLGTSTIRPTASPILVPGTKTILYLIVAGVIFLLVLIAVVILRFSHILKSIEHMRERFGFFRNAHGSKRRMRVLLNRKNVSDVDFAAEWQRIMKQYLEYRFSYPFGAVTSKRIALKIKEINGNSLSAGQENAVDYLTALFIRTDYIRYAQGSIDSRLLPVEEHSAAFAKGERKNMVDTSCQTIARLEANYNIDPGEKEIDDRKEEKKKERKDKKEERKNSSAELMRKIKQSFLGFVKREDEEDD